MIPAHPGSLLIAHHLCRDAELQWLAPAPAVPSAGEPAATEASSDRGDAEWIVVLDDAVGITVAADGAEAIAGTPGAQLLQDEGAVRVYIVPIPDRAMVREAIADELERVGTAVLAGAPALECYDATAPEALRLQRDDVAGFVAGHAPAARNLYGGLLLGLLRRELAAGLEGDDPPAAWREAQAFLEAEVAGRDLPRLDRVAAEDARELLDQGAPAALLDDPALVEHSEAVWGVAAALYAALEQRAAD